MRTRTLLGSTVVFALPATAAADVIDFTTDVVTQGAVIDRLPGATVSRGVSGLYADGLAQLDGGAYNYYGANDLYITFDAPTALGSIDVWVLPSSLSSLPAASELTFEMSDATGAVIREVVYTPTGSQDTLALGASDVTTLLIHHTGGADFYGDGYTSAWYWIDSLVLTTCGDGVVEEECDDGGVVDGDGCAADCTIEDGYTCAGEPSLCADIDECAEGTDACPDNASCENTAGAYDCVCDPGYADDGAGCTDVDECAEGTHDCHPDATCENLDGTFDCACDDGFVGDGRECEPEDDGGTGGDDGGTGGDDGGTGGDDGGTGGDDGGTGGDDGGTGDGGDDAPDKGCACDQGGAVPALGGWVLLGLVPLLRRRA